jgi:hypothetical protein
MRTIDTFGWVKRGLLAALSALLLSCSLYNEPHRTTGAGVPDTANPAGKEAPKYDLQYIESDDRGWFWDPNQANKALRQVEKHTADGDTLVLLFIHGWHHSADCYDDNLEAFKNVLSRLYEELQQPMYSTAREFLYKSPNPPAVKIIGIYVGWRGRSLPGFLDYSTFWGRKSAAQRVGAGDLQEFMARLQQLYDDHAAGKNKHFFGLVSIGHSFGGAVLLTATSRYFESQLQGANRNSGFLAAAPTLTPASAPVAKSPVDNHVQALRGFGDIVVLVNPAIEAEAYERINVLSRLMIYRTDQTPLLITFSAKNDGPRKDFFEPGRIAGEFFTAAAYSDDPRERAAERKALGVYDFDGTGLTHELVPAQDHPLSVTPVKMTGDPLCKGQPLGEFDWWQWTGFAAGPTTVFAGDTIPVVDIKFDAALAERVKQFDFSADLQFAGVKLKSASPYGDNKTPRPVTPYQPFMVVQVDKRIIDGHNGIFSEPFMNFLLRYIGFIEAKRYLLSPAASAAASGASGM